jgi:hypothetical protein
MPGENWRARLCWLPGLPSFSATGQVNIEMAGEPRKSKGWRTANSYPASSILLDLLILAEGTIFL